MPELPEVETVVRIIRPMVEGKRMASCRFTVPRQLAPQTPRQLSRALSGQRIHGVNRRGKFILLEMENGTLVVHLRMTGRMYVRPAKFPGEYERALFELNDGKEILVLRDSRTLGTIRYYPNGSEIESISNLGWEPLEEDVDAGMLRGAFARRSMPIKPVLLDQTIWAGIGNIYASEALWEAGIDPRKPANKLSRVQLQRLCITVPAVLRRALDHGGTTLRDFADPNGQPGSYQREFRVYDREGEPCYRCNKTIIRITQAQRSTYFCKGCQKMK